MRPLDPVGTKRFGERKWPGGQDLGEIKILRWAVGGAEGLKWDPRSHQRQHHNPEHDSLLTHSRPEV